MSDDTTEPGALSAAELQRALDRLKPKVPLTSDELETLREVIREWRFQQMRRAERRRNWPLIAAIISVLTSAVGWAVSALLSLASHADKVLPK